MRTQFLRRKEKYENKVKINVFCWTHQRTGVLGQTTTLPMRDTGEYRVAAGACPGTAAIGVITRRKASMASVRDCRVWTAWAWGLHSCREARNWVDFISAPPGSHNEEQKIPPPVSGRKRGKSLLRNNSQASSFYQTNSARKQFRQSCALS